MNTICANLSNLWCTLNNSVLLCVLCGEPPVLPHRLKARARLLRIQITVSHHQRPRKHPFQFAQQGQQAGALFQRPRIGRLSTGIQSTFVADTYRVAVVPFAMRTDLFQRTSAANTAVAGDVKMIANVAESPVTDMVFAATLKIQAPPLWGGGAVDNKQGNGSHGFSR